MPNGNSQPGLTLSRTLSKFFLSTFVVCSFVAYAVHERLGSMDAPAGGLGQNLNGSTTQDFGQSQTQPGLGSPQDVPAPADSASGISQSAPQTAPNAAAPTRGQYRDGTYTGPQVDAYWGNVQVRAVVQNGKLSSVQFVEYPNDRRTSVRINTIAMPYLQSEAVQAQSANVDVISGATLTSEAFMQSLDTALRTARTT